MINLIFIYLYLLYGIINYEKISKKYLMILLLFLIKIIINYRKCTLSYIECKLLHKDKKDSYINQFFDSIIDVRYSKHIYIILSISLMIILYNLHIYIDMIKCLSK